MSDSIKSILYALCANFMVALVKLAAAIITGSGSMMAETIHSFADCGNQGLLLLGVKKAKKPANPDFPLGFGKEIYFWSFIVALMLFSIGGLFSIYEGVHKLHSTTPLERPYIAVGVLIFSILAEGAALWGCIKQINKKRGSKSLWKWFKDSRQSELIVIFGEDMAAMLGLVFALLAVTLTIITKNPVYDACGSIVIGSLLIIVAFLIGIEIKNLLIGQGVEQEKKEDYLQFLNSSDGVDHVINIITLQMGNDVMVAIKARMNHFSDSNALIDTINNCEKNFRIKFPEIEWIFFEPDNKD